jgi:hypothetical protein
MSAPRAQAGRDMAVRARTSGQEASVLPTSWDQFNRSAASLPWA